MNGGDGKDEAQGLARALKAANLTPEREKEVVEEIVRIVDSEKRGNRECGACTLCCKLVPVEEINKPKGEWCRFSRSRKGCSLYPKHPLSCRTWSCEWLRGYLPEGMYPHTSHCVVDTQMEVVTVRNNETGQIGQIKAFQIWVDPKYPNAWKEGLVGEFVRYMSEKESHPTIIRTSDGNDYIVVVDSQGGGGEFLIRPRQPQDEDEDPDIVQARKARVQETMKIFQRLNPTPKHRDEPI